MPLRKFIPCNAGAIHRRHRQAWPRTSEKCPISDIMRCVPIQIALNRNFGGRLSPTKKPRDIPRAIMFDDLIVRSELGDNRRIKVIVQLDAHDPLSVVVERHH